MKHIDTKSFIIGILATALFLACSDSINKAAVHEAHAHHDEDSKQSKVWDDKQEWEWKIVNPLLKTGSKNTISNTAGWEPVIPAPRFPEVYVRRRIK